MDAGTAVPGSLVAEDGTGELATTAEIRHCKNPDCLKVLPNNGRGHEYCSPACVRAFGGYFQLRKRTTPFRKVDGSRSALYLAIRTLKGGQTPVRARSD